MYKQCQCGRLIEEGNHPQYCQQCHTFTHTGYTREYYGKQASDETVEQKVVIGRAKATKG